ncbi:MAG TPA: zinc ABC transporter substrate-binding protein [Dissulfurispiraceae bacterium]|nr:zinc ABC transporter substrate-binding protein [Dissulfurispiraceae bacterium]
MKRGIFLSLLSTLLFVGVLSCSENPAKNDVSPRLRVVTTLFVLYDFARAVGGDQAEVSLLIPPGVEPHGYEPKPGDIARMKGADLCIYTGSAMEPWFDRVLTVLDTRKTSVVEAGGGVHSASDIRDHGGGGGHYDPHVWLDLSSAQRMVDTIRDGFAHRDPAHGEQYAANAEALKSRLAALDERFRRGLSTCSSRVIIYGGHTAFSYLAKRYGLQFEAAYKGFSPDAEPTPRHLAELTEKMKRYGLKYVFYEELVAPRVAQTLARETGAELLMLHGAHNVSRQDMEKGVTFIVLMERNLANLRVGLQCR